MLMQRFGVTNKEHYCMLWYFLEWSIVQTSFLSWLTSRASIWFALTLNIIIILRFRNRVSSSVIEVNSNSSSKNTDQQRLKRDTLVSRTLDVQMRNEEKSVKDFAQATYKALPNFYRVSFLSVTIKRRYLKNHVNGNKFFPSHSRTWLICRLFKCPSSTQK